MGSSSKGLTDLFDISDRSVLIIGGCGAFGSASAKALASAGCKLTLADRGKQKLNKVSTEIKALGAEVTTINIWPDTESNAETIIRSAVNNYGTLDLMLVTLGTNSVAHIEGHNFNDWRNVMTANLDYYWLACQAAGRQFAKQTKSKNRNKIVVMSSTRGRHGLPNGYSSYCASKSGLDGMVRALACEWGSKGININAIGPTVFPSSLSDWMFSEKEPGKSARENMLDRVPIGRLSSTDDLIGGLIYLLSPASDYVTGQTLYIDGGYTAN